MKTTGSLLRRYALGTLHYALPAMVFDRMPTDPAFVGIPTFLKLPHVETPQQLEAERPDAVIVGAPFDMGTTNRPGARFGPRAIRQASNLGRAIYHLELEIQPFRVLRVFDYGDAAIVPSSIERSHEAIKQKVAEVARLGAIPIVLGGDHSITLPSATAVADVVGRGKVGVVHFDAHADTAEDNWGVLLGHGTPMRRLIDSGAVPGRNFVQVGLAAEVLDALAERATELRQRLRAAPQQYEDEDHDVRIVDLPVAAELDAFATDALDIATVSEPWLTRLRRGGHAVLFARASDYLPDFQFGYLLYGPSLLTDNPEAGERFLTAYLKATRQLNRDGKSPRHLAILMKHTSLDEATLEEACWPHLDDDGRVRVQSLEQYQEWALERGLIDRIVSTEEMHDPRFLEAANRSLAESGGGP